MDETTREALSKSFGPEAVRQKKGQGNRTMDYVSHGMVTKRLNDAAPGWHAEMIERWITETNGALHCLGGVMRLTIGDVTREEAGGPTRQGTLADDLKNTYSDCLKRCAMRFGVALDMWESAEENDEDAADPPPGRTLAEADLSGVGHGRRDTAHPPPAFTRPRETPVPPATRPTARAARLDILAEELEPLARQVRASDEALSPAEYARYHKLDAAYKARYAEVLAIMRDDEADPQRRKAALHEYFGGTRTLAGLGRYKEVAAKSGLPSDDVAAAYDFHHNRLAQLLAPVGISG